MRDMCGTCHMRRMSCAVDICGWLAYVICGDIRGCFTHVICGGICGVACTCHVSQERSHAVKCENTTAGFFERAPRWFARMASGGFQRPVAPTTDGRPTPRKCTGIPTQSSVGLAVGRFQCENICPQHISLAPNAQNQMTKWSGCDRDP